MNNKLIKATTLITFIVLLSAFIAYKSDFFNTENENAVLTMNTVKISTVHVSVDSPPTNETIKLSPGMWSTSKSVIVTDHKLKFPDKDTTITDQRLKQLTNDTVSSKNNTK